MIKNKILRYLLFLVGICILGVFSLAMAFMYFSFTLPRITSLNDYRPSIPSKILASDATVLAEIGKEKRKVVEIENIPKIIIDAFLSAEDDSFFQHSGVDYLGIARAMVANLKAGRIVQGGSTITQQVAKSLLLSNERSIARKIKDFLLAQKIEKYLTKEEILFLYLNQVYLGGGNYGVHAAVEGYFEKELHEITIAEAAVIAGLLVAPGKYSPYRNPKAAIRRQRYVLRRMYEVGKITEEEYEQATNEVIKFRRRSASSFKAGHFTDWIRQTVIQKVGEEAFLNGGLTVETTLDWKLQQWAEKAVYDGIKVIDKRQGYKGTTEQLEEKEWEEFSKNQRLDIYDKKSSYFTIMEEGEIKYEFSLEPEEWEQLQVHRKKTALSLKNRRFVPGIWKDDPIVKHLDMGEDHYYKAIVTKVDDRARIIYVEVAGVPGIIPHENFKWAHKRNISKDKRNHYEVTKPSTIVKKGDLIDVTIQKKFERFYSQVTTSFQQYLNGRKTKKAILKQRYLRCLLDQKPQVEGALVALSPFSGKIIAFVGGVDFSKSQFNRAIQSQRQPGSSFKPILYAAALENGFGPNSIIIDSPESLGGVNQSLNWKPRNYDGKFKGPMTLRNALEVSRNIPTIKIAQDIGVNTIVNFVDRIGMNVSLAKDLSLSLGSFGVTLMNLTTTYAIFPNGGKKIQPYSIVSITDSSGKEYLEEIEEEISKNKEVKMDSSENTEEDSLDNKKDNPFLENLKGDQIYDRRLAYLMTNLLRGVILHGTGRGARSLGSSLGGKTGTTNDYVDAWFLGFSSNIVTGVWTGFDNNETLGMGETGARSALPIWKTFMAKGLKKYGDRSFTGPPGIIHVTINKETGRPADPQQDGGFMETFVEGFEPGIREENLEVADDGPLDVLEDDDFYK